MEVLQLKNVNPPKMQFSNTITFLVAAICLIVASIVIGEHVKASRTPIDTTKFPGEARPDAWWLPLHETLVREAESTAHDVIFYGDSITEAWRGTSAGKHADRYQDNAKAFTHTFQPHLLGKKKKTLQVFKLLLGNAVGDSLYYSHSLTRT